MSRKSSLKYQRVLLVEDEPGLILTLTDLLKDEGYSVESIQDGKQALETACEADYDVIVLDVMLPGMNGFEVCRTLRRRGIRTPILILTARGEVSDRVSGLKLGADDYLPKPFVIPEFLARLQALLRRASLSDNNRKRRPFQFDSTCVDFSSTEVRVDGKLVEMSAREFEFLCYLIEHRSLTLSRSQLLKDVWGYDSAAQTRTVDVHFGLLRQKLERDAKHPRHFLTVRGLGYKFVD